MEAAAARGAALARERPTRAGASTAPDPRDAAAHPIDGVVLCSCCGRFPLVGERVTRRATHAGEAWACDSCERSGRGERLGTVVESDRVRSLGGAANVRRAA